MAFFLSSYPSSMPSDSAGGSLGLNNDTAPYGQGQFVAVEFDTFRNIWDSSDNHVGIDINSIKSRKIASLPSDRALNGTWTATIEYNSTTRMLNASLRSHDDPSMEPAVVTYLVNLKEVLPREVAVGFSAATGIYAELSQILAWSFNSTLSSTPTPHKGAISKLLVIVLVVPLLASVLCFTVYIGFIRKHRKGSKGKDKMNVRQDEALVWRLEGRSSEFTVYNFPQVLEATGNFSEENKLGQGGFGPVYKGEFPDGLEIAVKRLASHSGQGFTEFRNEIQLIAKLQHTNLVRLLGCCTQEEEKILMYEYLPNKSLDFYIFDETRRALLDWTRRLAIIEGIAQGLIYLHKHSRLRVIHRDLKASNILLDREMNPKISDFGLAKIFSTNDTEGNTRRIVGTYGYMAPEYALEGLFSVKSDVFSFGVLTLEIISGKRTSSLHGYGEFISLQGHAWQLWKDGLWHQLVDASLATEVHTEEIRRYINIALLCVQENAADRPTMSNVVSMLSNESMILPEPMPPGYFHIRKTTEEESIVVESPSDLNHMTISALDGR